MHEMIRDSHSPEVELYPDILLADLYFRYGSVERAVRGQDNFPVSIADFHRKVRKFGIIKQVGRSRLSLAKTLYFFSQLAIDPAVPLERLYRGMPPSVKQSASVASLHRIYNHAMNRIERVHATGVILSPPADSSRVLVAKEKSGESTILFGHSSKDEPNNDSILRVLQHEFSTKLVLDQKLVRGAELTKRFIPQDPKPLFHFHILDIGIDIYHLELPAEVPVSCCSSYKVDSHEFVEAEKVASGQGTETNYRFGVPEIVSHYRELVFGNATVTEQVSSLNQALFSLQ